MPMHSSATVTCASSPRGPVQRKRRGRRIGSMASWMRANVVLRHFGANARSPRSMLPLRPGGCRSVGGTGLGLRALREGLAPVPDISPGIRDEVAELYRRLGGVAFREALARLDPASATRFPSGDRTRLTRGPSRSRAPPARLIGANGGAGRRSPTPYAPSRPSCWRRRGEALYAACDARFAAKWSPAGGARRGGGARWRATCHPDSAGDESGRPARAVRPSARRAQRCDDAHRRRPAGHAPLRQAPDDLGSAI